MKINLCGIELKNPVIAASGTFGFGREYNSFYDIGILGGISSKGLTLKIRQGNDGVRIAETPSGILNSVGLQNPGVDYFINNDLQFMKQSGTVVIANAAGNTVEEYVEITEKLSNSQVDMIELNISCPNVKQGGLAFGVQPSMVEYIVKEVKKVCTKPLIVKLSPNVANISDNAKAAEQGGADCISLINTLSAMAIDWKTRKPILHNTIGGLSGPAVKPVALRMVWQCYNAVKIPIIGMGGICSADDVLEFIVCGATAVMVGTHNISNPNACKTIIEELGKILKQENISDITKLTGTLEVNK